MRKNERNRERYTLHSYHSWNTFAKQMIAYNNRTQNDCHARNETQSENICVHFFLLPFSWRNSNNCSRKIAHGSRMLFSSSVFFHSVLFFCCFFSPCRLLMRAVLLWFSLIPSDSYIKKAFSSIIRLDELKMANAHKWDKKNVNGRERTSPISNANCSYRKNYNRLLPPVKWLSPSFAQSFVFFYSQPLNVSFFFYCCYRRRRRTFIEIVLIISHNFGRIFHISSTIFCLF